MEEDVASSPAWADDGNHLAPDAWRRPRDSTLPASGAWRPSDPTADRQFLQMAVDRPFVLEGGGQLREITIAFETWGELNADRSNAILVCHALTGDAHAAGRTGPGQATPGWWDAIIGPGRPLDTDRYFVVCPNVLGGCQGSTGPASHRPDRNAPYGPSFPVVTIRDMVRTQARLAEVLGIIRWHSVIGGSMGGMQALEWGVMWPDRVGSVVAIATCAAATAQQIAWWSCGRRAIALDANWNGGDYYDAPPGKGPHAGLSLARMMSQITFRTDDVFTDRFGRDVVEPIDESFDMWQRFQVERYLEHHGHKLVRRFDANSYLVLAKAMDLHDIGRDRGGIDLALTRITAPTLVMGVSSDVLYPSYQQHYIADALRRSGVPARYAEIDSPHGHDAFLIEHRQVGAALTAFFDELEITGATQ
ncbi:MAG TPA: homoserine O-acetyltransferase [Acidimicrobiales bacterium]|jgi:homoserine O-acetyltransferase|nr:homoserine O-acetyltransferase [Acidimicrobiales bacterium]